MWSKVSDKVKHQRIAQTLLNIAAMPFANCAGIEPEDQIRIELNFDT